MSDRRKTLTPREAYDAITEASYRSGTFIHVIQFNPDALEAADKLARALIMAGLATDTEKGLRALGEVDGFTEP